MPRISGVSFWISCKKFTCNVEVRHGIIVDSAPILRRFIGQPFVNLINWAVKLGDFKLEKISAKKGD